MKITDFPIMLMVQHGNVYHHAWVLPGRKAFLIQNFSASLHEFKKC